MGCLSQGKKLLPLALILYGMGFLGKLLSTMGKQVVGPPVEAHFWWQYLVPNMTPKQRLNDNLELPPVPAPTTQTASMASGSLEEKPTALLRSVQPRPYAGVPETSSPECFVKGQASEVKEAEILLCYQLAKFVTVIKEGVVSPFIREEDTVYKRNSRLLPPGQPSSQRDTVVVIPDPGGLSPSLKCCWKTSKGP